MPPIAFLLAVLGVTAAAVIIDLALRRSRSTKVSALAGDWKLSFTALDRFRLTPRVATRFPIPGAADVVIRDLLYGQEPGGGFRYIFTVEYTLGLLRTKRRCASAAMLVEGGPALFAGEFFSAVTLAPHDRSLIDQYRWLRDQQSV